MKSMSVLTITPTLHLPKMTSQRSRDSPKRSKAFQTLGHDCEMHAEEDQISLAYPGRSIWAKFFRTYLRLNLVHERLCKSSVIGLRSHGAVELEKQMQILYYPFSMHPFSICRIKWECIMVTIFLAQLILVPMDVCLSYFPNVCPFFSSQSFVITRTVLDFICCIDVVVNSFTGYYDESEKEVVLGLNKIFIHYLKGNFFTDVISSIPTHLELTMDFKSGKDSPVFHILQGISLLKYIKYFSLRRYGLKLCKIFNVDFYVRQYMLLFLTLVLYWHIISHSLVFFHMITFGETVDKSHILQGDFFRFWVHNIYNAALIISVSTDGHPSDIQERWPIRHAQMWAVIMLTVFLWLFSIFVKIFLLAKVIAVINARTSPRTKYSEILRQLIEFMRHRKLPMSLQRRMLAFYDYKYRKNFFKESEIFETLSGQLRTEITMQTCRQLVESVEILKGLPMSLIMKIVACLKRDIFLTNDVVVRVNTPGDAMYFIAHGSVAVYSRLGQEVCHLEDGAYFGEVALVIPNTLRVATVVAVEITELYKLDRKDFIKAIHAYPDLLEKIQKIATDRSEKTSALEQHYKFKHGSFT